MIKVTAEQLCQIAYERRITQWTADACNICDYPIRFLFNNKVDVRFDPGCNCSIETARPIRFQTSSWQLVADYINNQTDEEKIKQIKQFWKI